MLGSTKPIIPLIGMIFLMQLCFSGARLAATLRTLEITNGSASITAVVLAATYFLPMLSSIMLGRWVDKQYKYIPLAVGALVVFISMLLFAFAQTVLGLILAALALGAGYQLFQMTVQHIIGKLIQDLDMRAQWFSWLTLATSISLFISSIAVGYALEFYKVEKTYLLLAVGPIIAMLFILWLQPTLHQLKAIQPVVLTHSTGQVVRLRTRDLLKNGAILRVILVATAVSTAWEMHSFLIPLVGDRRNFTESEVGWIISSFSLGTLIIRLLMPALLKRLYVWHIVATGLGVAIIIYALYPILTDIPSAIAEGFGRMFVGMLLFSFLLGMGLGSAQPNILAQLHEHAPYGRSAETSGLRSTFSYCANFFVPLLLGLVSNYVDTFIPFFCIVALIASVWVWAFGRPSP